MSIFRDPGPGVGPFVNQSDIKPGSDLMGLAPIGIRWEAKMGPKGKIKPAGDCPRSEFVLTHAMHNGQWHEVKS